jgi:flagellar hook protein FlgE
MRKKLYSLLGLFSLSLMGCGGTSAPITLTNPVTVSFTQCPATSSPFHLAINGQGAFRMNNNGVISYLSSGDFQLEISNSLMACLTFPAFSGNIISGTGNRLTGYNIDSSGALLSNLDDINIFWAGSMPPSSTHNITAKINLNSTVSTLSAGAFDPANPATYHYTTSVNVYDSLGNALPLQLFYIHTGAMNWHLFGVANGTTVDIGQLTFTGTGPLQSTTPLAPMPISIPITSGAITPLPMLLDPRGTIEASSAFSVTALTQDGFSFGNVIGFSIDINGKIMGNYDNGQMRQVAQIALVTQ